MKKTAYLSLGSNLGQRAAHLRAAIEQLRGLGEITAVSSFYESEPVDFTAQPWFMNCAVELQTQLLPKQLLARTQQIERALGRRRQAATKGPRLIDIDILLFGHSVVDTAQLVIPHPALHQRRFVLEPLAEIAPEARHPVFRITVRQLREALSVPGQAVHRVRE